MQRLERLKQFVARHIALQRIQDVVVGQGAAPTANRWGPPDRIEKLAPQRKGYFLYNNGVDEREWDLHLHT